MSNWQETDIGQIPSDWDHGCLLDIAAKEKKAIISGPFGSNISRKYFVDEGVPVIRGNNLTLNIGQRFIDNKFVYVTKEKAEDLNTWATVDDLIFAAAGTIGQVGVIAHGQKYRAYIISNKQLRVTVDTSKMLPIFAYYWFASNFMQDWITSCDTGSTIPLINLTVLKSLPVSIPPIYEQKAIASVFSSLDDKIDLLHRQNKTLEAMAETLFRRWFVEEAQKDWEEGKIPDEFDYSMGVSPPGESYNETGDGIPMFQGNADFEFRFPKRRIFTTDPKRFAEKNDTLISVRAPVGAQNMANEKCCIGRGVSAFRYRRNNTYYTYTYFKLKSLMKEIQSFNDTGTVFGSISKSNFEAFEIVIPPSELVDRYQAEVKPLDDKVISNTIQIRTLEKLRDTLLPKLMSGEVRVEYAK